VVSDKTNKIYTGLVEFLKEYHPKVKCGTSYSETVKLPYVYFFLLDEPTRLTTLSNTEDGVNLVYQIEVYTTDGSDKTRKIAHDIRSYMVGLGFKIRTFMPVQTPSNISRFVIRCERLDV